MRRFFRLRRESRRESEVPAYDAGPNVQVNFWIWRPILAGIATLHEVEREWTLDDLMDCHEAMDIQAEQDDYIKKFYEDKK